MFPRQNCADPCADDTRHPDTNSHARTPGAAAKSRALLFRYDHGASAAASNADASGAQKRSMQNWLAPAPAALCAQCGYDLQCLPGGYAGSPAARTSVTVGVQDAAPANRAARY